MLREVPERKEKEPQIQSFKPAVHVMFGLRGFFNEYHRITDM